MNNKAVIIGSGIAGIAAAIRLRVKGYQVEVFEKNAVPGGKIAEIKMNGFRFDAGPSLFTMPHYVDELFRLARKNPKDYFDYIKLDEICTYHWNDGTKFIASSDVNKMARDASKLFNVTAKQLEDKLEKAAYIEEQVGELFLEQSIHHWSNFLNWSTVKAVFNSAKLGLNKTLHEVNEKSFSDPKMIQIFDRYATYNGSNPFQTPGIMEVIPHYEYNIGAYFPKKGMVDIVNSLVRLGEDIGIKFSYNSEVKEILYEESNIKGVNIANDKSLEADIVVSNMDVYYTYNKLLQGIEQPNKMLSQERSSSALIFYWGMNRKFDELGVHNIFFADDYKAEFKSVFNDKDVYDDPTIYVHISSKVKSDDAPELGENWFVMINTPSKGEVDWDEYIRLAKENIQAKLSRLLGVDISDYIVCEDQLFPSLIEERTMSYQGALYGTSSNSKFAAFLRHPNFHKKLKGLYFVGGSTHPGGGIPLCLLSAKIAADHVTYA